MIFGKLWRALTAQLNKVANLFWQADPIAQMQYEYDLAVGLIDHALDRIAGGLRLWSDDGNFSPDERVEQGRFAGVGPADQHGESGAEVRRDFGYQMRPGI